VARSLTAAIAAVTTPWAVTTSATTVAWSEANTPESVLSYVRAVSAPEIKFAESWQAPVMTLLAMSCGGGVAWSLSISWRLAPSALAELAKRSGIAMVFIVCVA